MKQIQKLFKLFTIVMAVAALGTTDAFAFNSNYYSKVTVTSVGEGKVYVNYKSEADTPEYAETASAESGADNQSSAPSHTYHLYAQANDGYRFAGWYNNEACDGDFLSTEEKYAVTITANTSVGNATKNYYAKFEEATIPVFRKDTEHGYINLSEGATTGYGLTVEHVSATFTSSNEAVLTVDANGVVTPITKGSAVVTAEADGYENISTIVTVIDDLTAGKTQIGNSDFEDWSNVTSSNHAPANWNSFETNEGSLATFARAQQVDMVEGGRPGSNGLYCVDIWSRSVMGTVAQGNLTLGFVNAGSASAVAAANHNRSKITDPSKSETIDKIPTAIKAWVKFVPAAENAEHPNARVAATIHDAYNYITQGAPQFETDANAAHAVAQAAQNFPACEWTELTIPFELTGNAILDGQLYIIVNISTNADAGEGQAGDHLYIDDIELVYGTDYDKVPVTVSDAKYATFVAPFDVKMPAAITASTVETVGTEVEARLDLEAVDDNLVLANTPVILSSKDAQDRVAYGVAKPAEAVEGLLTGVYEDTKAPVGSYVLQNIDGVVGFYQVAAGQQPTVKANHAYLTVVSEAKVFVFTSDDATAIQGIQAEAEQGAAIYNLAGQRVQKAVKGINIINGKKILK